MNPLTWLLIVLASFIAGAMNAVAGGGTFVSFPALTSGAGLSEKVANMTSTIGLWPGSAASVVAAQDDFRRLPRGMLFGYGTVCLVGGGAGAVLLLRTSVATFSLVIPWLLLFATAIFACSKPIANWAGRKHGDRSLKWTLFVGLIQAVVALYGGYFGAGIGVLTLAGLSFAGLEDLHQMNALKVLLSTLINLVAAIVFLCFPSRDESVRWNIALVMAASSIVSGFFGMALARRIKQDQLRVVILTVGVTLTAYYFYKNYGPILRHASAHAATAGIARYAPAALGRDRLMFAPKGNSKNL